MTNVAPDTPWCHGYDGLFILRPLATMTPASRRHRPRGRTWTHTGSLGAIQVRMLLSFQRPPRAPMEGTPPWTCATASSASRSQTGRASIALRGDPMKGLRPEAQGPAQREV